jgi:hypothetical protein
MAVHIRKKSPRAPSLPLNEALDRALKVYDQERLHPAPTDVVAQALGYKSANNGSALTVIASLRYFGLLERPKDGFLSVNKSVEAYKFAPDENVRKSLLHEFLKCPPLYQELLEKYSASLPSEANLKFELIQKGFLPQTSQPILSAFLQSVAFVGYYDQKIEMNSESDTSKVDSVSESESKQKERQNTDYPKNQYNAISGPDRGSIAQIDTSRIDQIPIRLPGGRKAWITIPSPFYVADKARLKAQIDLLLSDDEQ